MRYLRYLKCRLVVLHTKFALGSFSINISWIWMSLIVLTNSRKLTIFFYTTKMSNQLLTGSTLSLERDHWKAHRFRQRRIFLHKLNNAVRQLFRNKDKTPFNRLHLKSTECANTSRTCELYNSHCFRHMNALWGLKNCVTSPSRKSRWQ